MMLLGGFWIIVGEGDNEGEGVGFEGFFVVVVGVAMWVVFGSMFAWRSGWYYWRERMERETQIYGLYYEVVVIWWGEKR